MTPSGTVSTHPQHAGWMQSSSSPCLTCFGRWLRRTSPYVLVAQGALDPLNDARARAAMFGRIGKEVTVDLLELGHCPHDEGAEEVAAAIERWLP